MHCHRIAVGREVEATRAELAAAQLRFNATAADAASGQAGAAEVRPIACWMVWLIARATCDGSRLTQSSSALQAVVSLQAEVERQEVELARLRLLMTHLSRR